jgi:DNA-binding MurR/RpiR family transcriptional regulator
MHHDPSPGGVQLSGVVNHAAPPVGLPADHALTERLRTAFDTLSPGQQRVARLLLEAPYDVAFLPVAEIGRRAEVSDSTVVRFAAEVGYSGFAELRQELQSTLVARSAPIDLLRERLRGRPGDPRDAIALEVENLRLLEESLTPELVGRVVERLLAAERVYVLGMRSGFGVAHLFWHLLHQVMGNVRLLTALGGSLPDDLVDLTAGDVLILFTTPRYARQILQVAGHARRQGVDVIVITDSVLSPAGRVAWLTLPVPIRSTSFYPSMVAAHVVVNVLAAEVARRRQEVATEHLARLEVVADEFHLFHEDD